MIDKFWGLTPLAWQAIGTLTAAFGVLLAIAAAVTGYRQLTAARKLREDQARPYVIPDFVPNEASGTLVDFTLVNLGKTPAYDVTIKLDPTPRRAREDVEELRIDKARIFQEPILMFAPGRQIRFFFDYLPEREATDLPRTYRATISYRGTSKKGFLRATQKPFTEIYTLDLNLLHDTMRTEVFGLHDAVQELKKLNLAFHDAAIMQRTIPVVHEERSAHEARRAEQLDQQKRLHQEIRAQLRTERDERSQTDLPDARRSATRSVLLLASWLRRIVQRAPRP